MRMLKLPSNDMLPSRSEWPHSTSQCRLLVICSFPPASTSLTAFLRISMLGLCFSSIFLIFFRHVERECLSKLTCPHALGNHTYIESSLNECDVFFPFYPSQALDHLLSVFKAIIRHDRHSLIWKRQSCWFQDEAFTRTFRHSSPVRKPKHGCLALRHLLASALRLK